ncbi:PTS sugar transporter subunit IIA [Mesomycoplasma neurolyticum]|uniref:Ascorbate-specific PTS system EIIA component n=1 Tax=Mesomycoplasma neurolyticum TaxID=2120 RepID=A0A449A4G9_9BACT|nr:PTS sugar transporter subunit IIA [Mesomycoplasma neurolyticum]VEU59063.1 ascorbate-specific PTS system enzyme II Ccomponent [Mesomycoplasma neurolyticum]
MAKINLLEILKKHKTVNLNLEAKDWKEAVYLATKPLIDKNLVLNSYYEAIIKSTVEHGPYYIIADNLAMPHASSDSGVNENSFSLITLKKPVYFDNDERPVRILITLAATSPEVHTSEALPQIAAVFEEEKTINEILNAKNDEEVFAIIEKIDFTKYLS